MILKNVEMDNMITALDAFLDRTDKIGYAAARNTRILGNEASEYLVRKEKLIFKYGEEDAENGHSSIGPSSPNFELFVKELEEWAYIEHDVQVYTITREEAEQSGLSYREMAGIIWMITEE